MPKKRINSKRKFVDALQIHGIISRCKQYDRAFVCPSRGELGCQDHNLAKFYTRTYNCHITVTYVVNPVVRRELGDSFGFPLEDGECSMAINKPDAHRHRSQVAESANFLPQQEVSRQKLVMALVGTPFHAS